MRISTLLPLALVTFAALPAVAQAQGVGMQGSGMNTNGDMSGMAGAPGGMKGQTQEKKASLPPPDVLPGARSRPDTVAPLKGGTNDLPPTEALFDAINRGDIVTARDAINRGADLDSTNLLGLTPIELSVDLGRNDISFLLLSLRGAPGSMQASRQPSDTAMPPPPTTDRRGRRINATAIASAADSQPIREAPPGPTRAPVLFAGNGGAPVPSAGFLGFDPQR